jgi:hypothetical protein
VVRPLPHDFGIDLQVEVFEHAEPDSRGGSRYRATGGHIACQVKTTDELKIHGSSASFELDATDLHLAESMGASAPLLLLVVDRPTRAVYYLCLTDYVPFVLDESNSNWRTLSRPTVRVPLRNVLDPNDPALLDEHWGYFRNLALRAKLYSAGAALAHAQHELELAIDAFSEAVASALTPSRMNLLFGAVVRTASRAFKACDDVVTQRLSDDGSPFAGLFRSTIEWRTRAAPPLERARSIMSTLISSTPESEWRWEKYEMAVQELNDVLMGIGSSALVLRTYEDVGRLIRLEQELLGAN